MRKVLLSLLVSVSLAATATSTFAMEEQDQDLAGVPSQVKKTPRSFQGRAGLPGISLLTEDQLNLLLKVVHPKDRGMIFKSHEIFYHLMEKTPIELGCPGQLIQMKNNGVLTGNSPSTMQGIN